MMGHKTRWFLLLTCLHFKPVRRWNMLMQCSGTRIGHIVTTARWSCFLDHINCDFLLIDLCVQAAVEKMCRVYEDQLNESRSRADELQRQLSEVNAQKARAVTETSTAHRHTWHWFYRFEHLILGCLNCLSHLPVCCVRIIRTNA